METFCRITMQLPLFQIKLKTFPLPQHRDHFVFTRVSLVETAGTFYMLQACMQGNCL